MNIEVIHESIIKNINSEKENLPVIERKLHELSMIVSDETLDDETKTILEQEIQEISKEYDFISSNKKLYLYMLKSIPIIEQYRSELKVPIQVDFMTNTIISNELKIKDICKQYFLLIKDTYPEYYIHIPKDTKEKCELCSSTEEINDEAIICVCGVEKNILQLSFSYGDSDRVNITSRYIYERKIHFKDCINQFQGKQNRTIHPDIYKELDEKFRMNHLIPDVDEDIPKCIKYEKITKHHILNFLKEMNCSKHYEDINLIYHNITGNKLDNISHLENILLDDFEKLNMLYEKRYIKTKLIARKNFINTQYVLYQLLKRHKYPCAESDFSFLKTIDKKSNHDVICGDLFRELGWNHSKVF